jgi:CBS-domain-containing membrane protein
MQITPRSSGQRRRALPAPVSGRSVGDIMSTDLVTVDPTCSPAEALETALAHRISHLVVARARRTLGVLCTCDLWSARGTAVEQAMSAPAIRPGPGARIADAAELVRVYAIGLLPVVDSGRLCGVITRGDLARLGVLDLGDHRCASCASHHHLRRMPGYDLAFCLLCLDPRSPG